MRSAEAHVAKPPRRSLAGPVLRSLLAGVFAHAVVYACWAFQGKAMLRTLGTAGAYLAWVGLLGLLLAITLQIARPRDIAPGPFTRLILTALTMHTLLWAAAWWIAPNRQGETFAVVGGAACMSVLFLGPMAGFWRLMAVCLLAAVTSWVGYFGGMTAHDAVLLGGAPPQVVRIAKVVWGVWHGAGLGIAIGFALRQRARVARSRPPTSVPAAAPAPCE